MKHAMNTQESKDTVLSQALRALCLTRDYVGEDALPAIKGWDWFDAGCAIAAQIPGDEWTEQFQLRVNDWSVRRARRDIDSCVTDEAVDGGA